MADPSDHWHPLARAEEVSVPVALLRPDLAKYLWLLLFPVGAVLRRLEPPEVEQAAAGRDQPS